MHPENKELDPSFTKAIDKTFDGLQYSRIRLKACTVLTGIRWTM